MANNTVTATSETPTNDSDNYDPIKMLRDYLKDTPNAPSNLSNFLINRLGDQIKWYDKKSGYFKKKWERFRKTIIVLSASIPFLVGLIGVTIAGAPSPYLDFCLKLIVGAAGVTIAILEGLNSLYKSQEHYVDYRVTAEQLRQEFSYFLGKSGDYEGLSDEVAHPKLFARVEAIIAKENNHWAEVTRQNDKPIKADDIQNAMQDFLKKYGIESFAATVKADKPGDKPKADAPKTDKKEKEEPKG